MIQARQVFFAIYSGTFQSNKVNVVGSRLPADARNAGRGDGQLAGRVS